MNWYMIQFINTIQFESTNYIIFDNTLKENTIEYCEIIEREIYNGVQMQQFGISFFDFLIDQLKRGYAIFLRINQKCIPQAKVSFDYNHEVLISGYDGDTKKFTVWDFFDGNKYDCINIDQVTLLKSLETFGKLNHPDNPDKDKTSKIIAFRKKKQGIATDTRYDSHLFSFLLERWLKGEKLGNLYYGRACYELLRYDINYCVSNLSVRTLHVLYDHKVASLKTVIYLMETNKIKYDESIISNMKKLMELTLLYRNILMKHGHMDDLESVSCKNILLSYLGQIDALDKKVYTQLYKAIHKNFFYI